MIFVDGVPFPTPTNSSQLSNTLVALLEHPVLASTSQSLKAMEEQKFLKAEKSGSEISAHSRSVYVFQREYATVNPALVDFIGTDEATTCVGLVIRNRQNGMTSVAHLDSPKVVDIGLFQMLSLFDHNFDVDLDVHFVGGFEDASPNHTRISPTSNSHGKMDGYSLPLCKKIVKALGMRQERFHIQTLLVLGHNTHRDSLGNAYPIFNGFLVETSTGSLMPASFDRTTRCPDEIIRRIRVTASCEDPAWNGKLLETYDTQTDRFVIAPCSWTMYQLHMALTSWHLSDTEILQQCSTSPSAEAPDFVDNLRRQWKYLMEHPDWQDTFPGRQPRTFERTADGTWKRCLVSSHAPRNESPVCTSYR